ncbi:hypothetical protein HR51_39605 [Burkholderia cepacia]|nr:hypothetical protein HR51_39605 [Burkholderia cepacia]
MRAGCHDFCNRRIHDLTILFIRLSSQIDIDFDQIRIEVVCNRTHSFTHRSDEGREDDPLYVNLIHLTLQYAILTLCVSHASEGLPI